jgi:hypothetical protein
VVRVNIIVSVPLSFLSHRAYLIRSSLICWSVRLRIGFLERRPNRPRPRTNLATAAQRKHRQHTPAIFSRLEYTFTCDARFTRYHCATRIDATAHDCTRHGRTSPRPHAASAEATRTPTTTPTRRARCTVIPLAVESEWQHRYGRKRTATLRSEPQPLRQPRATQCCHCAQSLTHLPCLVGQYRPCISSIASRPIRISSCRRRRIPLAAHNRS